MKRSAPLILGLALATGNFASASEDTRPPRPLTHEQHSLKRALADCLYAYYVYSNPVPLWLEDRDFCTVGHSPFFQYGDGLLQIRPTNGRNRYHRADPATIHAPEELRGSTSFLPGSPILYGDLCRSAEYGDGGLLHGHAK